MFRQNEIRPGKKKVDRGRYRWNLHVILLKFQWSFQFQCLFSSAIVLPTQRTYLFNFKGYNISEKFSADEIHVLHVRRLHFPFGAFVWTEILLYNPFLIVTIVEWRMKFFLTFILKNFLQIFNILNHNSYRIKIKCIFWTKRHFS